MTALLAADVIALLQHTLQHVTVTHCRLFTGNTVLFTELKEAHIAHHRYHSGVLSQSALVQHPLGANGDHLVAVHQLAVFVHSQHTVCVTIKCQP